ncbi:MAG: dTMP kinase [Candidatus Dadabacteria bacterium]|nr:MAG: dTMP kinase [Candidatus Dadabacteria bacterium]
MVVTDSNLEQLEHIRFIAIEGVNGAGKTTLQRKVCAYLKEKGFNAVTTMEPGSTEIGRALREIVLKRKGITPICELFLFCADRAQHVAEVIRPAINDGKIVVTDRYYYSTAVFQGEGRGIDKQIVSTLNEVAIEGVRPDLVFLLDLPPEEGLRRNRQKLDKDRFEDEDPSFQRKIREGFLNIARESKEPFYIIDAAQSQENVWESALKVLNVAFKG